MNKKHLKMLGKLMHNKRKMVKESLLAMTGSSHPQILHVLGAIKDITIMILVDKSTTLIDRFAISKLTLQVVHGTKTQLMVANRTHLICDSHCISLFDSLQSMQN